MKLHLADWQSFQCRSCGRCCRNSWDIQVPTEARAEIARSNAARKVRGSGYQPLTVLKTGMVVTGRKPDGACVFLTEGNLCSIHGELGGSRKPIACQLFPYSLTATPDGYFASLSFACPSVVADRGGDLQANRNELEGLLERVTAAEVPERVWLVAGRSVPWASFRLLEQALEASYRPSEPVSSLLDLAVSVLLAVPDSDDGIDWAGLDKPRDDALEESMLAMFATSVVAIWELPNHPEQRQAFSQALLAGEPLFSQRQQMTLPGFELGPISSELLRESLARYFRNAIFGKSLLSAPVVQRLLTLACGSALVIYYAEAFRQAQGAPEVNLESLTRAFELVESELVTHTASADPLFATFESTLCQVYERER